MKDNGCTTVQRQWPHELLVASFLWSFHTGVCPLLFFPLSKGTFPFTRKSGALFWLCSLPLSSKGREESISFKPSLPEKVPQLSLSSQEALFVCQQPHPQTSAASDKKRASREAREESREERRQERGERKEGEEEAEEEKKKQKKKPQTVTVHWIDDRAQIQSLKKKIMLK